MYYYDYLYVCYMLDIGERAIELMFSVYCHTDENKDYLSMYLSKNNQWFEHLNLNGHCNVPIVMS